MTYLFVLPTYKIVNLTINTTVNRNSVDSNNNLLVEGISTSNQIADNGQP